MKIWFGHLSVILNAPGADSGTFGIARVAWWIGVQLIQETGL